MPYRMPTVVLPERPSPSKLGIIIELMFLLGALVSSLITAGAVGVTQARFNGICLLSSTVTCKEDTPKHWLITFGADNVGLCHFCVHFQIACVLTSFVFAVYRIVVLCCNKYNIAILRILTSGIFAVYAILSLATAAVLTAGLNGFCSSLLNACSPATLDTTCADYQTLITWTGEDGCSFYTDLKLGEVTSWISFLFWVSLSILSLVLFIQARRANRVPPPLPVIPTPSHETKPIPEPVNRPV